MTIAQLLESRAAKVAEATALLDNAKKENRSLDENGQKRFDTLDAEISGLDQQITREKKIAEWQRQTNAKPITDHGRDSLETEERKCSMVKFLRLAMPEFAGDPELAREREVSAEYAKRAGKNGVFCPMSLFEVEKRAQMVGSGVTGGYLVNDDLRADLYVDLLRSKLISAVRGATVLNGLVGDISIPGGSQDATAAWIGEGQELTGSDVHFRQISLRPRTVGALTEYSRNMLLQSTPAIDAIVRNSMSAVIARAMDSAAISGNGGAAPEGILNTPGIQASTMTTPSWEGVMEIIEKIETANADMGALGWAMHPTLRRKLRTTLKTSEDTASNFIMTDPNTLAGYGVSTSTLLPKGSGSPATATLIYGNWNDLLIGYWGAFEILVNPYADSVYAKGNVQVRALMSADVSVRHAESFVAATGVLTAA